jgi:hypothetical protein
MGGTTMDDAQGSTWSQADEAHYQVSEAVVTLNRALHSAAEAGVWIELGLLPIDGHVPSIRVAIVARTAAGLAE